MAMKKAAPRRGRERRGRERADARLSMRLEAGVAAGASRIVTESQNISSSGVYCHSSHYLAPLSKVQITIILPRIPGGEAQAQELLKCDGIVVRCEPRHSDRSDTPYELACMFTGMVPAMLRRVEEFVTWRNLQALRAAVGPAPRTPFRRPAPPNSERAQRPGLRTAAAAPERKSARGAGRSRG